MFRAIVLMGRPSCARLIIVCKREFDLTWAHGTDTLSILLVFLYSKLMLNSSVDHQLKQQYSPSWSVRSMAGVHSKIGPGKYWPGRTKSASILGLPDHKFGPPPDPFFLADLVPSRRIRPPLQSVQLTN